MPVFRAEIKIKLKKGVTDPEGQNTKRALVLLGFKGITDVSSVKIFEIVLTSKNDKRAKDTLDDMCRRLLANPVIHSYTISLKKY